MFNSLSKRSAMTTYRIGWVAGDPELVELFRQVKTNIDSGTPTFIQDGAVAALGDESHVRAFREQYRRKRDLLCAALVEAGLPDCRPEGVAVRVAARARAPELGCNSPPPCCTRRSPS